MSGAIRIMRQTLARPLRSVEITERRDEGPAAQLEGRAARMPARVRSDRWSLSNCANAASTPSINLPVEVSSIGSVAAAMRCPSTADDSFSAARGDLAS